MAAAGVDPLEHFLQLGIGEGRQAYAAIGDSIVGGFDAQFYLLHNPDVAAAGVDPLAHFNMFGWHEGRNPNAWFDTAGYLAHYADVAAAGVNPLEHYWQFGWKEGRDPSAASTRSAISRPTPTLRPPASTRSSTSCCSASTRAGTAVNDGVWH